MTKKVLFIDVDGTLVGFKDGKQIIPESAKQAIQQARNNGHLAFLCTGRSQAEIGKIMDIGFDGVIGAAGGYVTYHGEKILHKRLASEVVQEISTYFNDNGVAFYLESNSGLYCNPTMKHFIDENFSTDTPEEDSFASLNKPLEEADFNDINKISFLSPTLSYNEIEAKYKNNFYVVKASWGVKNTEAGEISNPGINKATAIHFLLNHLGLEDADTYGFGDSMNDIEMFNCVKHSIAMGDSKHGVKELAEFITKDVLDDGIAFACEHYGLI